jgi:hypothetical protein
VKKGVVAPTACVKLTGMYLRDRLPSTMVQQKMLASSATLASCARLLSGRMGVHLPSDSR